MVDVRRFLVIICRFKESAAYGGMQPISVDCATDAWRDKHCTFHLFLIFNTTEYLDSISAATCIYILQMLIHWLVGTCMQERMLAADAAWIAFGQVHRIH
jgi:hypothetical protein